MLLFLKRLFCRHNWKFSRSIHGDEINLHNGKRYLFSCTKCNDMKAK